MKGKVSIILMLILFVFISSTAILARTGGLMIRPSVIQKQIEANKKYFDSIKLVNNTAEELHLVAFTSNWIVNDNKNLELINGNEEEKINLIKAIRFNPRDFVLKPGQSQIVRYVLRTPPQLPPGEYRIAMVFKNKNPIKGDYRGQIINLTYQIVSTVYLSTGNVKRSADITEFNVDEGDKNLKITGKIESTGNGSFLSRGYYKLIRDGRTVIEDTIKDNLTILPGDNSRFSFNINKENVKPGIYDLKVIWEHIPAGYLGKNDFSEYNGQAATVKEMRVSVK